jgi:hypothetical protein
LPKVGGIPFKISAIEIVDSFQVPGGAVNNLDYPRGLRLVTTLDLPATNLTTRFSGFATTQMFINPASGLYFQTGGKFLDEHGEGRPEITVHGLKLVVREIKLTGIIDKFSNQVRCAESSRCRSRDAKPDRRQSASPKVGCNAQLMRSHRHDRRPPDQRRRPSEPERS